MKSRQEGMALIVSLSLMAMALLVGVSSMQTSRMEETAAGSNRAAANARMAAEFGASEQLEAISSAVLSDYPTCDATLDFGNTTSVDNSQDQTAVYSYEICSDFDKNVVVVTSKGVAGDVSRVVQVQMNIQSVESDFTTLAAINFASQVSSFEAPSSNSFGVEGLIDDKFEGGVLPAITTNGQESYIKSQIGGDRIDNYNGGISDEIGNSILADANDFFEFVEDLKIYAESIGRGFDSISTTGNSKTNLGSSGNPMVTYVRGDMSMQGNASGAGVLIVDGDYGTSGTPYFEGLVIVLGDTFGISGGGNGGLSGALISAPMEDSVDGGKQFSSTDVETNGGGNADYSHDEPALSAAFNLLPEELQILWETKNTTTFLPPTRSVASWKEIQSY